MIDAGRLPTWPIFGDEEREGLLRVLESGNWWYGEKVEEFETKYAEFQGAKYAVSCCNGTLALEAALAALDIGAGDEVIIPPYTFVATATSVLRIGATPIFADIELDSLCIDPADVERKITPKTRAIVPVHLAGRMADMDRLNDIAGRHNLVIVEDACHAWGSQWKSKGAGTLGNCGAFSFQHSKNITSAEGGAIVTDDETLADAIRSYTNCGRSKTGAWYEHYKLATNSRLTEFQAAILLGQLSRLEAQTLKRQENAAILDEAINKLPGLRIVKPDPRMTRRSYHMYAFRIAQDAGFTREQFIEATRAQGLPVMAGYTFPLYKNPLFERIGEARPAGAFRLPYEDVDYTKVVCPNCEVICETVCWMLHRFLLAEEDQIREIAGAIKVAYEQLA